MQRNNFFKCTEKKGARFWNIEQFNFENMGVTFYVYKKHSFVCTDGISFECTEGICRIHNIHIS